MSDVKVRSFWTDVHVPSHAPPIEIEHGLGTREVFVEVRYAEATRAARVGDLQLHFMVVLDEDRVRLNGIPPGKYRAVALG